jgi:uncharacterized protein (TIRG00374 family)
MTSAPTASDRPPTRPEQFEDEEMPRVALTRRRALLFGLFVVSAIAFLYFVLPRLAGLSETWHRLNDGDPWWLALAFVFEVLEFVGYIWLFRTVFVRGYERRLGWRASYEITMAGVAATRLFAAGGAGGIALTVWALRRAGMDRRTVACRMVANLVLLYVVYALALIVTGLLLRTSVVPGEHPFVLTVVPAAVAAIAMLVFALIGLLPSDLDRRLERWSHGGGRVARIVAKVSTLPTSVGSGVRTAWDLVRAREPGVLGAVMWWGFDIAVLWACFRAFGKAPPVSIVVMSYFVGMLANTLPLPGGIGGVDGGMIGTFIAFGVPGGLAVVAVLVYRGYSFWLPTVPGAIAYVQLRRRVAGWQTEHEPAAITARV